MICLSPAYFYRSTKSASTYRSTRYPASGEVGSESGSRATGIRYQIPVAWSNHSAPDGQQWHPDATATRPAASEARDHHTHALRWREPPNAKGSDGIQARTAEVLRSEIWQAPFSIGQGSPKRVALVFAAKPRPRATTAIAAALSAQVSQAQRADGK